MFKMNEGKTIVNSLFFTLSTEKKDFVYFFYGFWKEKFKLANKSAF